MDNLEKIDNLTPEYIYNTMNRLTPQQRQIVVAIIRYGRPLRVKDLAVGARIWQQKRTSAQVCRLVRKGILVKQGRAYDIKNPDFKMVLASRVGTY